MNSDDLAIFLHVANVRSFSRAALDLGTNQSTVSRRITTLEVELGVRLFRRSGRGVGLTERGEQLLTYATTLEQTLEAARAAMRSGSGHGPASLTIAAQPTVARIMFGHLGRRLKADYPQTRIRFVEGLASQILSRLQDGEIDLAVMYVPAHPGATRYDALLAEAVCLVAPPSHGMPSTTVEVSSLGNFPLILPSTHHGLRVLVETLAQRHGFAPNVTLECDGSVSLTKQLVMEGCGFTVLPAASVLEETAARRLCCYPLTEPAVTRDVAIAWPQNRAMAEGVWNVARIIREIATRLSTDGSWPGTTLYDSRATFP
ncbi:LysR family transcriptional regulator [Paraburkholderia guartelaensis]|uniref:LysR family transcriptional regulator n=1 Tax=Paraburkholderia guartelaensis TaxID=2546446 RepID=A0ABU9S5Y4_9BURK